MLSRTRGVAVFLQVRLDSSRLPVKALYELSGKTIVAHCMEILRELDAQYYCLLCDAESAPVLAPFAKDCGFSLFSGPKDDVLSRFVLAANHYSVEHILRATADNPLVSLELSRLVQESYLDAGADYCVARTIPHGSCIEAVSARSLRIVKAESTDLYDHEHVCPGVYRNPERFRVLYVDPPSALARPDISVTVDTMEDYQRIRGLFAQVYHGYPVALSDAITYMDTKRIST